jgi:DNA-binding GntR family transcriptional regulator
MPEIRRHDAPYAQVAQHIRDQIHSGALHPGDRVPSVREIAAEWKISRATADKALSVLRSEGLLKAVTGIGTQVAETIPTVQTGGERFARMLSQGRATKPGEFSEIISSELAPAIEEAAAFLQIEPGAQAIQRKRRFIDDEGVSDISTSWLSAELAEAVPALLEVASIPGGTIGAIREATGRQPAQFVTLLKARLATEEEAEALGLAVPVAVMITQARVHDEDGKPLEFGEDVVAPERGYAVGGDLSLL